MHQVYNLSSVVSGERHRFLSLLHTFVLISATYTQTEEQKDKREYSQYFLVQRHTILVFKKGCHRVTPP